MRFSFRFSILFALLFAASAFAQNNPVADPKAVVVSGNIRFTVLTQQLVRMEWAEDGKFEDHASLVFVNRRLPVPKLSVTQNDENLTIATTQLSCTIVRTRANSLPTT
jgi:hypothetical protein